jgi:hypothetical protein
LNKHGTEFEGQPPTGWCGASDLTVGVSAEVKRQQGKKLSVCRRLTLLLLNLIFVPRISVAVGLRFFSRQKRHDDTTTDTTGMAVSLVVALLYLALVGVASAGIPGCASDASCNDYNACTTDTCSAGTCAYTTIPGCVVSYYSFNNDTQVGFDVAGKKVERLTTDLSHRPHAKAVTTWASGT